MLVNLTPHNVNLPGLTLPPAGLARVSVTMAEVGHGTMPDHIGAVPLLRGTYGDVTGLPEPEEGTIYIVSAMVRMALPGRKDLASPARLVRDDKGNITGCEALEIN